MSITLHLVLHFVCSFLGLFAGMFGGFAAAYAANRAEMGDGVAIASFFAVLSAGLLLPWLLFRRLIPARCPACDGPAFPRGRRPIRYCCRCCGHVEVTSVSYGRRDDY